jgi:ATP-dependent DNA ligase
MAALRPQSCIIDGEAVGRGNDDLPSFDLLRYGRRDASVVLYAFDLVELNGDDLNAGAAANQIAVARGTVRPCPA